MSGMKNYDEKVFKKGDIILVLSVIGIAVIWFCLHGSYEEGQKVNVSVAGKKSTYSLQKNQEIVLEQNKREANVLVIEDAKVYMKRADCPDQVCVHHKPISKEGEMIICLPNEVFVEVESTIENEIDN